MNNLKKIIAVAALLLALVPTAASASGELAVTELMYDAAGSDTGAEWVELYNASGATVTVVPGSGAGSWRFSDGSNHVIRLVQGSADIPPGGTFILTASSTAFLQAYPGFVGTMATSSFSLPNSGGTIGMTADGGSTWMAQLTYSSAWGGAGDGSSLEKVDVVGPDEAGNWRSSMLPGGTPGEIPSSGGSNRPPSAVAGGSRFVTVGTPVAFDGGQSGDPDGDPLTFSWDFGDGSTGSGVLASHAYSLAGRYVAVLTVSDGRLQATSAAAVTVFNEISDEQQEPIPGTPPVPIIDGPVSGSIGDPLRFSGARSYDEDAPLSGYRWSFGDGSVGDGIEVAHAFVEVGAYAVTLTVSDGSATSSTTTVVSIADHVPAVPAGRTTASSVRGDVAITELLPNPVGDDAQGEYVELQNVGEAAVSLGSWSLMDGRGRSYSVGEEGVADFPLEPGAYLVIPRVTSGLALPNASGTVQLIGWDGSARGSPVSYVNAKDGRAWSQQPDGTWDWSTPTPGQPNATAAEQSRTEPTSIRELVDGQNPTVLGVSAAVDFVPPPADASEPDGDDLVELIGVVTMPPGVAGKRLMYVVDYDADSKSADAGAGIGVYVTSGVVPNVAAGDVVSVRGKMGTTAGERQLKVGRDGSITVVGKAQVDPDPASADELDAGSVGRFVSVAGTVAKSSGKLATLDDGTGEVTIWFPSNGSVPKPSLKQGQQLAVAGVVRLASDGSVRVAPRDAAEVAVLQPEAEASPAGPSSSTGRGASGTPLRLLGDGANPLLPIGLAAAGAGLAGAIWWTRRGK